MSNIAELQQRFGIKGAAQIEAGRGGMPKLAVTTEKASAEIYLHGAHVTRFQPRGTAEVLFMSPHSVFDGHKPIRGGVPLVFPWFGPRADMPDRPPHGFARTRNWEIESCDVRGDGSVRVIFISRDDESTQTVWPNPFLLRLIVIVSSSLEMTMEVRNTGSKPFRFEEALHTYLAIGDIRKISIEGLTGADFLDRSDGEKRKKQGDQPIQFSSEMDRLYYSPASPVTVRDPVLKRSLVLHKERSNATVLWNPWFEKAAAMADLGADSFPQMVCVETANARECAVELGAGCAHRMTARIAVEA
jgi:D-hexose-6-phosphate mutarotase